MVKTHYNNNNKQSSLVFVRRPYVKLIEIFFPLGSDTKEAAAAVVALIDGRLFSQRVCMKPSGS